MILLETALPQYISIIVNTLWYFLKLPYHEKANENIKAN